MADLRGFDASAIEPASGFEPIPTGKYVAVITASDMRPTRAGDASYLHLEFTIIEGPYKGRKIWGRLCLDHPKEITRKIARSRLSAICRAVGVLKPNDSTELHNLPLTISVVSLRNAEGVAYSEIKGYGPCRTASKPPQGPPSAPPWRR